MFQRRTDALVVEAVQLVPGQVPALHAFIRRARPDASFTAGPGLDVRMTDGDRSRVIPAGTWAVLVDGFILFLTQYEFAECFVEVPGHAAVPGPPPTGRND